MTRRATQFQVFPCSLKLANRIVDQLHRHSEPIQGHRWSLLAMDADGLAGVAIVGRTTARGAHSDTTAEITRVCVPDNSPNACSFLYGACWRVWREMGGRRLITYTLKNESGASLRAAGFRPAAIVKAREWSCATRPRRSQPVYSEDKVRWEKP